MHPLFTHTLAGQHRDALETAACTYCHQVHTGGHGLATRLWAAIAGLRPESAGTACPSC